MEQLKTDILRSTDQ